MSQLLFSFLAAYLLTNLLEIAPFSLLLKKTFKSKISALLLINLITLPLLWLVLPFFYQHYLVAFLIAEALVVVAEAALIRLLLKQTALVSFKCSLLMNVLSAVVGLILF